MTNREKTAALCYVSPQGTTRKAGRKITSFLKDYGYARREYDLAGSGDDRLREAAEKTAREDLLIVGSPVYADHILDPVRRFLQYLPGAEEKPALVYATFGEVSKGVSLYEMSRALALKGYSVKGAAKVLCLHSMMFRSERPLGEGHPGTADWKVLEEWIGRVINRIEGDSDDELDVRGMRSRSRLYRLLTRTVFDMRFMGRVAPPISFDPEKCTDCGACKKRCPTGRLDSIPGAPPEGPCLHCYECVRSCPQGAMEAPMYYSYPFIRFFQSSASRREEQATKYYL